MYVTPDLTPAEQADYKRLGEELKQKNQGEIFSNKTWVDYLLKLTPFKDDFNS